MNPLNTARRLKAVVRDAIEDETFTLDEVLEVILILTKVLQDLSGEAERIAYRKCVATIADTKSE